MCLSHIQCVYMSNMTLTYSDVTRVAILSVCFFRNGHIYQQTNYRDVRSFTSAFEVSSNSVDIHNIKSYNEWIVAKWEFRYNGNNGHCCHLVVLTAFAAFAQSEMKCFDALHWARPFRAFLSQKPTMKLSLSLASRHIYLSPCKPVWRENHT